MRSVPILVVAFVAACGAAPAAQPPTSQPPTSQVTTSSSSTTTTTILATSLDVEIEPGADTRQDGYDGCYVYPTPCGATLVETALGAADEYADVEDPADYTPNVIEVAAGDTIVWTNNDPQIHTVTAVDGSFDSGDLFNGDEFSLVFDQPGEFEYFCVPHPWMRAVVVVEG